MPGGFVPTEPEPLQPWLPTPEPTPQPTPTRDWEFDNYFSEGVRQRVTPPVEEPEPFIPGLVEAKARIEEGWLTTWLRERAEERSTFFNNAALGLARNLGWANEKFAASLGVSLERGAKVDFPQYLKKAFMPPIPGQEVGKVWEDVFGLVFRTKGRPNSVMVAKGKQIVGFMLRQPMIQSYNVWNMDAKLHLSQGTWQDYIENYPTPGGVTNEDHERNVQLAVGIQTNYDRLFENYLNEGMSVWKAQALASANALRAGQKEKKEYFNFKAWAERTFTEEGAEAFARGERVAPFSETSQENWDASAGFRYTHSWPPTSETSLIEHKAALEAGLTPQQAGDLSEDPKVERWAEFLMDPNYVIPLDNLIIHGLWKIVKPVGKGVLRLGKWFSVKTGFSHFIENTIQTVGAHTAFNAKDALRVGAGALDQYSAAAVDMLEKHSDEFMERIPQFMRRAVMNAQPYVDDIRKVFTEVMTDDVVGEVSARLIREAARTGVELAEDVATSQASREVFERAVTRAADVVASIAKENVTDTMPKALRVLADSRGMKFISAITTKLNSTFVDVWLSLRPSFLIYNQTDGIIKTFLTGINPFNNLGDLLKRYGKFSPYGVDAATEAAETYGKRHLWSILFKGQNEDLLRAIGATIPETAKGTFGVARAYKPSFLRKLPLIGSVIDWSRSASGVIEVVGRSRLYLSSHLKYMDEGYDALLRNVWQTRYLEKMSGELGEYFSQRMGAADALSTDELLGIVDDVLKPGRQRVVVSNLANYPKPDALSKPLYDEVQQRLMALTDEAAQGSGLVARADIEQVVREAAESLIETRNAAVETARKFFADSLPGEFESADEMYDVLLRRVEDVPVTMEDFARAVDDMPMVAKSQRLRESNLLTMHWTDQAKLQKRIKEGTATWTEYHANHDMFFGARQARFAEFYEWQVETFRRFANDVDTLQVTRGGPTFNRQLLDDYLVGVRRLNEFELVRDKVRAELAEKLPRLSWEKGQAERVLTTKALDSLWATVKPEANDVMHRALVGVRQWFVDEGFGVPRHLYDPTQLAENVGWWRHLDQVDSFPDDVVRQHGPAFKALSDWYDDIVTKRTRPFTERVVTNTDRIIADYFRKTVSSDMAQLSSDAMETAVNLTNDTFFDYSTTNNLQNLIGKVVPFWRFASKNVPWWLGKFGTVSHLTVGVQHIRQIQAAANAHLPERMKYTIPIPLSAEIRGALGFDAVPIRVNPWIYFSFMQNVPGGTPYKMRQLSELPMNEEDADMLPGSQDLLTYAEQMGFGRWPYVDWLLGVYGLEGDDWYPREAFSTWSPLVDWAVREVTDYEKGFNIDRYMWENAPKVWNSLFGDTVFAWPYMNLTLFEDWATGSEVEGIFTDMSVEQQRILETMNPSEMHEQLNGLRENGTYDTIRAGVMSVFELSEEEQTLALADFSPDALAVYWEEINKTARRKAIRKKAAASVFGHLTGMYPSVVNTTELIARKLRYEKRLEKEMLGPGPEYRDFEKSYRYEHPGYSLGQTWRFGQFPWAETEAGLEAERWDAMIQDATGEYWERYTEWQQEYNQGWQEVYSRNPNDVIGLAAFRDESFKARDAMEQYYDDLIARRLTESMEKYELEHPGDVQGVAMLRKGFETTMYVGTHITEDQRQQLADYREELPEDKEGLAKLFQGFWREASERKPPNQPHTWPGLDKGFSIKLDWNPSSHNLEELEERRIADVVYALKDLQPQYDDFDNTADYYLARDEFFESLPEQIMKVPEAKARVEKLVADEGLSLAEAKETVANMYSPDEVMRYWQYARNPLEALEYAYKKRVYGPALDEWFTNIAPLYDIDPDLYYAASDDFYKRYEEFDATELIPYVMEDYPGKWTAVELHTAFAGMTMPAYRDRRREASRGESGLNSRIRYYYNQLPGEEKRQVRGAFGLPFVETFLAGQPNDLSVELRGDWLTTLTEMVGVEFDYHTIPGVDEVESRKQSRENKREFGLPYVGPPDMEEYALAEKLNEQYWALRQAGDERYQEIAVNPIWQKWFGKATSKSYFWNFYYRNVPPGWVGKELRENPLVQLLLDKGIRNTVASNTDYDRAVNLMESWLVLNSETLRDLEYDPAEFEEVRRLMNTFFDLPTNEAKTAFKKANPLLVKYLDKPSVAAKKTTTTRGYSSGYGYGGGRARARAPARVDYRPIWSTFRTRTGQSFITVLRMLTSYWRTGSMTDQVKTYLSSLHAEIGGELSFESWLDALRTAWLAQSVKRTTGGVRVPARPKIVRPYYETDRIRGRRRA